MNRYLSKLFDLFSKKSPKYNKDEVLLKVIDQPQIQTNVFVERGKNSAYERVQRLGEVDNLGDLINYGYGFFNVVNKKPIIPSDEEIKKNPRARSAKLRIARRN